MTKAISDNFKADAESEFESVQLERIFGVSVSEFDLKHDVGAIVDIEFLIQYEMLKSANEHPTLIRWTDVIRQLEDFAEQQIVNKQEKELLQQAYLSYRAAVHYQWLGGQIGSFKKLNEYRQQVMKVWQDHLVS